MSAHNLVSDAGGTPDRVSLHQLKVDCVIGVYAEERKKAQPVELDLELALEAGAQSPSSMAGTVDYARIAGEVRFLMQVSRFQLLEHAAEAIARYVLAPPTADVPHAGVSAVTVTLRKPRALEGVATPSVRITRRASDTRFTTESKGFGQVDIVYEQATSGHSVGIYRLRIKPLGEIPTHVHHVMEEHELVLGKGLLLQGRPVRRGTAFHWPRHFPHRYQNPTSIEQTLLCVDLPTFLQDDEREVEVPGDGLQPLEGEFFYPEGDGGAA